ncbi:MAG TPA: hypothetical protein VHA11_01660 [Bryobacteraceae bacterium]|nr:hypothetical protein [Bryobacteraceae bacterium]
MFRSADTNAEEQAGVVRDLLVRANIAAEVYDDTAAGIPEGVFEVQVPAAQQAEAEQCIASQQDFAPEALNRSHDLDPVPVFASDAPDAEMLATQIRSVLEAHQIPSVLVGGSMMPNLPYEVRVPRGRLEEARQAIADAEQAGPAAAEEGEQASEAGGSVELP